MSSRSLTKELFRDAWGAPRAGLSAVVELASGEQIGQLLEVTPAPRQQRSDVLRRMLERRDVRMAAPLLIQLPAATDLALREIRRAAAAFRRRGMRLCFAVVVEAPSVTREVFDAARGLGVRTIVSGDASRLIEWAGDDALGHLVLAPTSRGLSVVQPYERAAFLSVCRAARENGHLVWARHVDTLDDVVLCHRVSADWISGKAVGGTAGEPVRGHAFQRSLLRLAQRAASRDLDGAAILEADERSAIDLAALVASDPAVTDLAALVADVAAPLASAKRLAEQSAQLQSRAETMLRVADRELSQLLERVALGDPPHSERFDRCEHSYEEASALLQRADESSAASHRRSVLARASLELRKQVLRGALEARADRLSRPRGWARRFLVHAA
ncbi:MAG: hypothetical protein JNK04_07805 [Myxococcales bacterium]|nr:hypothetical protein [Myxococcales bacterium]